MNEHEICRIGEPRVFTGFVDDFESNIAAMEFSLDNGEHWTSYAVPNASPEAGISWSFSYTPTQAGWHFLQVRARDGAGQPSALISTVPFLAVETGSYDQALAVDNYQQESASPGASSIRPIANGTSRQARLFRSGTLAQADAGDALRINEFDIRTIYDMRTSREIAQAPDALFAGVCSVALTPSQEGRRKDANKRLVAGVIGEYGAPEERMIHNYRKYASDYPLLGKALRALADQGAPALVHCENGKDRTGVLCAIAQRIAGVSNEVILGDYLAYNELEARRIAKEAAQLGVGMTADEYAMLLSFLETRPSYLAAFFDEVNRQFGSFEEYVYEGLKLTSTQCQSLRDLVLGA